MSALQGIKAARMRTFRLEKTRRRCCDVRIKRKGVILIEQEIRGDYLLCLNLVWSKTDYFIICK